MSTNSALSVLVIDKNNSYRNEVIDIISNLGYDVVSCATEPDGIYMAKYKIEEGEAPFNIALLAAPTFGYDVSAVKETMERLIILNPTTSFIVSVEDSEFPAFVRKIRDKFTEEMTSFAEIMKEPFTEESLAVALKGAEAQLRKKEERMMSTQGAAGILMKK